MKIALSGADGFLGRALAKRLTDEGAIVGRVDGDLRSIKTVLDLNPSFNYFFHFGAPSSQVLFKRNYTYCVDATINGFLNVAKMCKEHGIKLIYPSTGVLSQGETNDYSKAKAVCERIHESMQLDALGFRIFATYGAGEDHKSDYASVPFLFTKKMLNKERPIIFGDGTQTRDFIYIDDVVDTILSKAQEESGIMDLGSGKQVSFNELVKTINDQLDVKIEPLYVEKPYNYVENTKSKLSFSKTSLQDGIKKIIESFK